MFLIFSLGQNSALLALSGTRLTYCSEIFSITRIHDCARVLMFRVTTVVTVLCLARPALEVPRPFACVIPNVVYVTIISMRKTCNSPALGTLLHWIRRQAFRFAISADGSGKRETSRSQASGVVAMFRYDAAFRFRQLINWDNGVLYTWLCHTLKPLLIAV